MRFEPWRVIEGSLVPRLSIRRRMVSIDWSTALRRRRVQGFRHEGQLDALVALPGR
jgi:hypothetical protein